jgi:hypothetical protein
MKKLAGLLLMSISAVSAGVADVSSLVESAREVPGEFAADSLIRLAEIPGLEPSRKIEFLQQAFQRARQAQLPYRRKTALVRMQGPLSFFNKVHDQGLDSLSLLARVVSDMAPLDLRQARDLLLKISPLQIPAVSCDEFLVYDVEPFYVSLGQVAKGLPENERFRLLQSYAGAIHSPVQVAFVAQLLADIELNRTDLTALVSAYAAALGKVAGDDRSFTYSRAAAGAIEGLAAVCKRQNISPLPLLESYRFYLVTHLSGQRCADNDLMDANGLSAFAAFGQRPEQATLDFAAYFNDRLRVPPLQPIGEPEAKPARIEGAATGIRWCQDPECIEISEKYRGLILSPAGTPYHTDQQRSPEWTKGLTETVGLLAAWKSASREMPIEHFREKASAYGELLTLTPAGVNRDLVFQSLLEFLRQSPIRDTNRVEWFLPANALIGRIALDPAGFGKYSEALRKLDDPVISLYARLEETAPRKPERIVPLL